jgi:hypothetical protein
LVIGTAGKSIGVCTALLRKLVSSHCVVNDDINAVCVGPAGFQRSSELLVGDLMSGFDQGLGKHDRCLALGTDQSSLTVDSAFVLVDLGELARDIGVGGETIVAAVSF